MGEEHKEEQKNMKQGPANEAGAAQENEVLGGEEVLEGECHDLLKQKEEEVQRLQDRLLRLAAEMDNTRKRLEREVSEGIAYANESLLRELLPVLDNLERAIEHGEGEASKESVLEGVRMTRKGFLDALAKFGCKPVEAMGQSFDPNYHEAMMQQESTDHPDNTIVQEFRRGYTLSDRLIRPSMVVVSRKPKTESSGE